MEKFKNNALKIGKFLFKTAYKIGIITAGATAFTNPISASIAGVSVVASVLSSIFRDKDFEALMKIINALAFNFDKAENDKKVNAVAILKKNDKK